MLRPRSADSLDGFGQRAELANEQYLSLTSVLEGFVIVKPNPDWKPDGEKISPSKMKVRRLWP